MEIYLAKTQGFCAGVTFAINIVELALAKYGSPLYVYHEIVHNTYVVNDFRQRGVVFVEDLNKVPAGERVIFSAHGVPPSILEAAQKRNLTYIDATCPLVTKVHNEATKFSKKHCETILIGHKGHQELIGTSGYVNPKHLHIVENEHDIEKLAISSGAHVAYITQTTLSVDETSAMIARLKEKFPHLSGPPRSDLCYATQNRQDAVKELSKICNTIIICGSPNSSKSNRLRETGEKTGVPSYIIDSAYQLDLKILEGKHRVGVSSGASVPRIIVDRLFGHIKNNFPGSIVHVLENPEKNIVFALPKI